MIVADSSSVISMAMNCLSRVIPELGVRIYVTPGVKQEILTRPMNIKRFALEAYRIKSLFDEGNIAVSEPDQKLVGELMEEANSIYQIKGKPIKVIHEGESEALALVKQHGAEALLIDERTTRFLIEDPHELRRLLEYRLNKGVTLDEGELKDFFALMPKVPVIRSTEVAYMAFEKGLIEELAGESRRHSLESLLSALKFSGCAISWEEIDEYKQAVSAPAQ
jgi:predicted nucleic acid-binding protein